MNVDELMSKNVKACGPGDTLAEAAELMWDYDIGCVPIVEAGGRLIGMITDRDICMTAYLKRKMLDQVAIREAMSHNVVCCDIHTTIKQAEEMMRQAQVRRLPITDQARRLVGILSLNDLAREAQRVRAAQTPDVDLRDVALTLSAVSQPPRVH